MKILFFKSLLTRCCFDFCRSKICCEDIYLATQHLNRKVDKNIGEEGRRQRRCRIALCSLSAYDIRERISEMQKIRALGTSDVTRD